MIDSHAHLTSPELIDSASEMAERAHEAGVEKIVNICTDVPSLEGGLALAKKDSSIFNTAATTPHDVEKEGETFFPIVKRHVNDLVAIGETGLDYFYEHSPKKLQQEYLQRYFALAKEANLPVIFHCREAFPDLFTIADEMYRDLPAVLHCFTGTLEEAKSCLDRGWFISFSGIITFKKSEALRKVVSYVPLDRMFVETDSPYLAPQSKRGKQNEPANVIEVAEKVAEEKGVNVEEVARQTAKNSAEFFRF